MDFIDVMANILIGISSGVFSSVIVSVCFYVITLEQSHLDEAKRMSYPLYSMLAYSLIPNMTQNSDRINIGEGLQNDLDEINDNFSQYEPWRYKGRLKEVMIEIYEFITDGRTHHAVAEQDLNTIKEKVTYLKDILEDYEKHFAKYCFQDILKNIVTKIAIIAFALFLVVFIVA